MSYGDNNKHFEHLRLPMTWTVLGVVGVISVLAVLMFMGDRRDRDEATAYGNRSGFDTVAGPVNNVLSWPVHKIGDGANWIDDYFFAVRENRLLKKKVAELSQYRDSYIELKDLNARYEALLKLRTDPPVDMVTARSISMTRGPFANNRLINAGSKDGVRFDNPVMSDHGLVGRVVGVSGEVSRVLMVTDVTSHVPVMILRSDGRAMMSGDGGGYPKLEWVRGQDTVKAGDQILTSGDGGVFPRGLPVGEAVKGVDGVWRVRLYANQGSIDFVKILLYKDFSQLPNADTLLRAPPISEVLPAPADPEKAHAALSSSSESAKPEPVKAASSAVPPATSATRIQAGVSSGPATGAANKAANKPVAKAAVSRPAAAGPASASSSLSAASRSNASHKVASQPAPQSPNLKPYVPPSSAAQERN